MDIKRFKRLSIPKIEAGKMTEVVRDVIKEVRTNKHSKIGLGHILVQLFEVCIFIFIEIIIWNLYYTIMLDNLR